MIRIMFLKSTSFFVSSTSENGAQVHGQRWLDCDHHWTVVKRLFIVIYSSKPVPCSCSRPIESVFNEPHLPCFTSCPQQTSLPTELVETRSACLPPYYTPSTVPCLAL